MTDLLDVRDVVFRYRRDLPLVLDHLSLSVSPGQVVGLLGPNGAGKTTIMSLAAGLLPMGEGKLEVCGGLAGSAKARKSISFVPQSGAVVDHLTARENLEFFAGLYNVRNSSMQVQKGLESMALEKHASTLARNLSVGTKRRLSFACGIIGEPLLLIADEVTAGVDPPSRDRILDEIKRLRDGGCGILYSTHYLHEVSRICDEVAMMAHGRIIERRQTSDYFENGVLTLESRFRELAGVELRD